MNTEGRWILVLPVLCFLVGAWYFTWDRSEVRVSFERAKKDWRAGSYDRAIQSYLSILEKHPQHSRAPECLWEVATIYYYNQYDISNAIFYFERLLRDYPDSKWALRSRLNLAEIFEVELNEISNAQKLWLEILEGDLDPSTRHRVRLKVADAYFRTEQFDLAFREFQGLLQEGDVDHHLVQQARVRLATIHQIRRQYDQSLQLLAAVLAARPCGHCRLQAQLGLVESYEFLDRLSEAIETVKSINEEDYPRERREELLHRLLEKRKYYEPKMKRGL